MQTFHDTPKRNTRRKNANIRNIHRKNKGNRCSHIPFEFRYLCCRQSDFDDQGIKRKFRIWLFSSCMNFYCIHSTLYWNGCFWKRVIFLGFGDTRNPTCSRRSQARTNLSSNFLFKAYKEPAVQILPFLKLTKEEPAVQMHGDISQLKIGFIIFCWRTLTHRFKAGPELGLLSGVYCMCAWRIRRCYDVN